MPSVVFQEIVTGSSGRNPFSEFLVLRFGPAFCWVYQPVPWPKLPDTPCTCAGVQGSREALSSGQGWGPTVSLTVLASRALSARLLTC